MTDYKFGTILTEFKRMYRLASYKCAAIDAFMLKSLMEMEGMTELQQIYTDGIGYYMSYNGGD